MTQSEETLTAAQAYEVELVGAPDVATWLELSARGDRMVPLLAASTVTGNDGRAVVLLRDERSHALKTISVSKAGTIEWTRTFADVADTSQPVLDASGNLYVAIDHVAKAQGVSWSQARSFIVSLDPRGVERWREVSPDSKSFFSLAIDGKGVLYAQRATSSIFDPIREHEIHAFARDGQRLFVVSAPTHSNARLSVGADGFVYAGCGTGSFTNGDCGIRRIGHDGVERWTYELPTTSTPLLRANGEVVFQSGFPPNAVQYGVIDDAGALIFSRPVDWQGGEPMFDRFYDGGRAVVGINDSHDKAARIDTATTTWWPQTIQSGLFDVSSELVASTTWAPADPMPSKLCTRDIAGASPETCIDSHLVHGTSLRVSRSDVFVVGFKCQSAACSGNADAIVLQKYAVKAR